MLKYARVGWVRLALAPVLCALCGLAPVAGAHAASGELPAQMARALEEHGLSGAVWATVEPDGERVGAAGQSNRATGAPLTPAHRVQVGSVGKTVLATGVLRLITQGRLSLDTAVADVLPQLPLDNRWSATDPVRIRHLLAHTAGLDNFRLWQVFSQASRADTPLIASVTGDDSLLRVQTRPGSRYAYSNVGYAVLGMVIESVTQQPYERYMDAQVLAPLGMADSTFGFVTQAGAGADARLAMGHFDDGTAQAAIPMYLRPAGQFTTTAGDMARFARFLMGDGALDGAPFIAPALMAGLGEPDGTDAAAAGLRIGHGLALAGRDRHGVYGWCHPGTTFGFVAMLCVFPEHDKAFFFATNTDSESADYDLFNRLLIDALAMPARPTLAPHSPPADVRDWDGFYVPVPKVMSSLAWVDDTLNVVRVRWDGAALRVKPLQSDERVLDPAGGALFRARDRHDVSHVLLKTADGVPVLSDGLHSYERVSTARVVLGWMSVAAGLLGLAYLLVSGLVRVLRGRMAWSDPMLPPLLASLALAAPVPLFFQQSFLQLGDRTAASITLAVVTAALPLVLVVGLVRRVRGGARGPMKIADTAALLAALQWTAVLAVAGLVPFRLWQ